MHVLCATYLEMGHIFWTQFHTLSTLPAMQINEQKKTYTMHYQCLILFQQFFDYTETFLKFEATENREWGEYFVPVLHLRPTWDD